MFCEKVPGGDLAYSELNRTIRRKTKKRCISNGEILFQFPWGKSMKIKNFFCKKRGVVAFGDPIHGLEKSSAGVVSAKRGSRH